MDYGYQPTGEFEPALQATIARLRAGNVQRRADLAQAIASRGVRTSGVSTIPQAQLATQEGAQEAGVISDFALRNAASNIEDRRIREGYAHDIDLANRAGGLQAALARRQLQAQLIGGGIGAVGNYALGKL